jgi:tetraacyldisaccharide 4'-kinase
LSALGSLYGRVAALRRAWYERVPDRRHRLARPVISVGNLVVGGSGKTPVVAWLARLLLEKGHRPAILSRGYGRRAHRDGVVVVSDGDRVLAPTAMSGDEPQMLARALPGVAVLVAPDRSLAGTLAERRLGCTIHLLDDGFQHLQLARDVDLLLVGRDDLTERILPSGRLRESLATARRADAVLVPGTEEDVAVVAATLHIEQAFRVVPRFGEPLLVHPNGATVHASAGKRAIAVAAIARPQRFFATLRSQGWDVVREFAFRDHHWFTPADLDRVRRAAREEHADIILTTAKDAVRIEAQDGHWAYLPMDVSIEPAAAFSSWLEQQL